MASPGLPEDITAGVTTGHVTDHEKIHDLLNEFDSAAQAQATGDLLVFQDGLIKRLPVGSDNQVLTADSAEAAGVKWATPTGGGGGGWTLLHTESVVSTVSTIDITGIPGNFDVLLVVAELRTTRASTQDFIRFRVGDAAVDTGNNYAYAMRRVGSSNETAHSGSSDHGKLLVAATAANAAAGLLGYAEIQIRDYADTSRPRQMRIQSHVLPGQYTNEGGAVWLNTADPISRIQLFAENGDFSDGRVRVFGQ